MRTKKMLWLNKTEQHWLIGTPRKWTARFGRWVMPTPPRAVGAFTARGFGWW